MLPRYKHHTRTQAILAIKSQRDTVPALPISAKIVGTSDSLSSLFFPLWLHVTISGRCQSLICRDQRSGLAVFSAS
ncbi:hypothetical protein [Xenorhabdus bovienii]|uniref:hypothetical protein n=1 Tax=Xenorhabdus bovienii TaxID=40576 RepID=UPI003DA4EA7B